MRRGAASGTTREDDAVVDADVAADVDAIGEVGDVCGDGDGVREFTAVGRVAGR
jgi:hypothetical protein